MSTHIWRAALAITLLIPLTVRADRTDFPVNDDVAAVEHSHPRVAVSGAGSSVIVWSDFRSGNNSIYMQRFGSSGLAIGTNKLINDDTGSTYHMSPSIAVDRYGKYSVTWVDYRNGTYPFYPDIYYQRLDSSTTAVGTNRNFTTERPDTLKESPDLDLNVWGTGVVVWADYRNRNWDIYGQLFAADGTLLGTNFKVNDDASTAQQHAPRVSVSPDGWFIVTWYDNRSGNDDVYVQRYDVNGVRIGANVRINSDNSGTRQAFPDIAADGAGHFTAAWVDWRNGTYPNNPDIYYRRFDTLMRAIIADTKVNTDGSIRAQREAAIASDRMGNVAIVWSDSTGSSFDIMGQMFGADGTLKGANYRANLLGDSAQLQPDVALDGRNRYVTWVDKRNGHYDIYASIIKYNDPSLAASPSALTFSMDAADTVAPTQQLIVSHVGYNQLNFSVLPSQAWLQVNPATGLTADTVTISIVPGQAVGTHLAVLTLVDQDNHDSSVVVPVRLDVTGPTLKLVPDTLRIRAVAHDADTTRTAIIVGNSGSGQFTWSAVPDSAWLTLSQDSGSAWDTITALIVTSGLDTGNYSASVIFTASGAGNSPDTLLVLLELLEHGTDTLTIGSASCQQSSQFSVPISAVLSQGVRQLTLPMMYDTGWIRVDSVRAVETIPAGIRTDVSIDQTSGLMALSMTGGSDTLTAGTSQLAVLYGTSRTREGVTLIEPRQADTSTAIVVYTDGRRAIPTAVSGEITVGSPTPVKEPLRVLPAKLELSQNYPNPFNGGTIIPFLLPKAGFVRLEIFNVLGQQVAVPISSRFSAGRHACVWSGVSENGRPAPSGIYFYRLRTESGTLVRKMVLLK